MGFLVKLDTNGNKSEILQNLLEEGLLDFVAMDVKTSLPQYKNLCGALVNEESVKKSIDLIKNSGVDYEFRTTLIKEIHTSEVLDSMKELLTGAKRFCLQVFRPGLTLKKEFGTYKTFSDEEMEILKKMFENVVEKVEIRN